MNYVCYQLNTDFRIAGVVCLFLLTPGFWLLTPSFTFYKQSGVKSVAVVKVRPDPKFSAFGEQVLR